MGIFRFFGGGKAVKSMVLFSVFYGCITGILRFFRQKKPSQRIFLVSCESTSAQNGKELFTTKAPRHQEHPKN
jgi:cysteine synthase